LRSSSGGNVTGSALQWQLGLLQPALPLLVAENEDLLGRAEFLLLMASTNHLPDLAVALTQMLAASRQLQPILCCMLVPQRSLMFLQERMLGSQGLVLDVSALPP